MKKKKEEERHDCRNLLLSFMDIKHSSLWFGLRQQWAEEFSFKHARCFGGFVSTLNSKSLRTDRLWIALFCLHLQQTVEVRSLHLPTCLPLTNFKRLLELDKTVVVERMKKQRCVLGSKQQVIHLLRECSGKYLAPEI